MKRRAPKGAAASIIVLFSAITLMMLTILGFVTGRLSTAKEEVSARTDAVIMTMTEAIKRRGPQDFCNDPAVRALLADYGGQCPQARYMPGANGNAGAYRLDYAAREINVEIPTGFFDHQNIEVNTQATGEVRHEYADVEERRPKFVLVLDYSGSMGARFGNGNRTDALKQAVNGLLGRGYRVDYGAVIFDDSIVATVPIARDNERAVAAQVNRFGPMGGTCYNGLATALGMLRQQPNHGYYVLFATDGDPNDRNGCSNGRAESVQLWNNDVTIFTLNIGAQGSFRQLLIDLSGAPNRRHDQRFALEAGNADALRRTFDRIIGFIVCRVNVPSPEVAPLREQIYVSVEQNGAERPVERVGLDPFMNQPEQFDGRAVCAFDPEGGEHGQLILNQAACQPILDGGARMVMRYERPGLATAQ